MMPSGADQTSLGTLDAATRSLVRLSAAVTGGAESEVRDAVADAAGHVPALWVEELLLQSYLFAGFPRALNAMREWRRTPQGAVAIASDGAEDLDAASWRQTGEATCARVYGDMYDRLRANVRALHPALDAWMVVEGYGKVLSRPGLDLPRRELCVVAACAAAKQDRQLLSHLHGALNVGAPAESVGRTLSAISDLLGPERYREVSLLWARVRGARAAASGARGDAPPPAAAR